MGLVEQSQIKVPIAWDSNGIPTDYNIIHPETDAEIVNFEDGKNAKEKFDEVSNKIGDLNTLTTTNKGSLVGATNELKSSLVEKVNKVYWYPEDYGAKGDGITDDTQAFLNMLTEMYTAKRYNRVVVLKPDTTYLISQTLPINHNLSIISHSRGSAATLKNVTTPMFYVPSENTSSGKIWSYNFLNVEFVGSNNDFILTNAYQHWDIMIDKCSFSGFNNLFPGINFYASNLNRIIGSAIKSIGTLKGSDNVFTKWVVTGLDTLVDVFMKLDNLAFTRIENNFFTGSLTSSCNKLIHGYRTKDVTFKNNWFDYSDGAGLYMEECSYFEVEGNTFRGNCRTSTDGMLTLKGCSNYKYSNNNFLNVHQGSQNMTALAYKIWDYAGFISKNVVIKDNFFEIPFFASVTLTNGLLTDGFVWEEPSQDIRYNSKCDLLPKYSLASTSVNGVTPVQTNDGGVVLNGTASANTSFYLAGAWGTSTPIFTAKAGMKIKIKTSDSNSNIKMMLVNNTTIIGTLLNNDVLSIGVDTPITGIALYIASGTTLAWVKANPALLLKSLS